MEQAIRELVGDFAFVALGDDKDPGVDPACPLIFYARDAGADQAAAAPERAARQRPVHLLHQRRGGRLNLNTTSPDRMSQLLETSGSRGGPRRDHRQHPGLAGRQRGAPPQRRRERRHLPEAAHPLPLQERQPRLGDELIQVKGVTPALMEGGGAPGLARPGDGPDALGQVQHQHGAAEVLRALDIGRRVHGDRATAPAGPLSSRPAGSGPGSAGGHQPHLPDRGRGDRRGPGPGPHHGDRSEGAGDPGDVADAGVVGSPLSVGISFRCRGLPFNLVA